MWNATSLLTWQLYVVLDPSAAHGRDLVWLAEGAIRGGADVIQLRDKTASTKQLITEATALLQVTRPAQIPLIINDRPDVVVAVSADGVHVGQEDLPVAAVRQLVGDQRIVGKSSHSLRQALEAEQEDVDYVAFGPLFPTPTKPDYAPVRVALVGQVATRIQKPLVVIGGIDETTLPEVLEAGARCVAVVRAVCGARDPEVAAQDLKQRLRQCASARH